MSNAAVKVREVLKASETPLTLTQIKAATPDLQSNEISMALCYLRRQRYLTRELVPNTEIGRKSVWQYRYHPQRLDIKD
jgi:hypothetical protein